MCSATTMGEPKRVDDSKFTTTRPGIFTSKEPSGMISAYHYALIEVQRKANMLS